MSQTYLVPCPSCQHPNQVEARHAGQELTCSECQKALVVPKLRELKEYPSPTDRRQDVETTISRVPPIKSWMFAFGLGLAAAGGLLGWALYNYSGTMLFEDVNVDEFVAKSSEEIQALSASEIWQVWSTNYAKQETLPEWQQAGWKQVHAQGLLLRNIAYGVMGLGCIGFLAFLGSMFIPNEKVRV